MDLLDCQDPLVLQDQLDQLARQDRKELLDLKVSGVIRVTQVPMATSAHRVLLVLLEQLVNLDSRAVLVL